MRSSASGHARLAFAGSMLVFGTIGLLRRFIDLPSAVIACFRGLLGCVLLLLLQRLRGRKPDLAALRRYLPALLISGGMIGFNWMLLFEAYRYTTIAVATLCYYMAPVLLIAFSPLLFEEKLTGRQIVCVLLAALGMVLVSGVLDGSGLNDGAMNGIALALGSATAVNRKYLGPVDAYDKTIVQLGAAGLVLVPYLLLTGGFAGLRVTPLSAGLMLLVSLTHTAIPYALYFGAMVRLPTQTVALMSYLDPITALLLSALVLHEPLRPRRRRPRPRRHPSERTLGTQKAHIKGSPERGAFFLAYLWIVVGFLVFGWNSLSIGAEVWYNKNNRGQRLMDLQRSETYEKITLGRHRRGRHCGPQNDPGDDAGEERRADRRHGHQR